MGRYTGPGNKPEILIEPGTGPYRRRQPGGLGQIVRIILGFCVLAAVIAGALLLVASFFTVLAFVVPVLLVGELIFALVNRNRLRTIIIRRR